MSVQVDLNCDLGESFGTYTIGQDEYVLDLVSSANIACGYHAGDHNIMSETVKLAVSKGVSIGAHPSLQDLIGFGRRIIQVDAKDVYNSILYQIGALDAFVKVNGAILQHVKPHGALYNMAAKDSKIATAIAEAIYDFRPELILYGLSNSELTKAGERIGIQVANEVFADRTYQEDGSLTPRSREDAFIDDPLVAARRVIDMVTKGSAEATNGRSIQLQADTICIHGDSLRALDFAKELRKELINHRIMIKAVGYSDG
ncbi:LamB/YcsF family protein [Bacillus sp. FJAT-45350]|uniref:LamB/YcsF family protein n=1 Tax=Bacillus sp. FJAT-45350 TaxID=2011014 RepID=UPI000BB77140|nr:5-oxoprolinase subunit PxpA [Bacillus sp. FJAT-45350]